MENFSSGINIPQIIVSSAEYGALTKDVKEALIMGGSVGISNLLPSGDYLGSGSEKYIVEPILAGILYAISKRVGGKKSSAMKDFGKGFLIGSSSAAVTFQLMSSWGAGLEGSQLDIYRSKNNIEKKRVLQLERQNSEDPLKKSKASSYPRFFNP